MRDIGEGLRDVAKALNAIAKELRYIRIQMANDSKEMDDRPLSNDPIMRNIQLGKGLPPLNTK